MLKRIISVWVDRIPSYKVSIRRKRMLGNKIVVIILAMLMVLGGIPGIQVPGDGNVYAAPVDTYSGEGAGTVEDPYQIATADQLDEVRDHIDSHFVLTKDIDLSGFAADKGWEPIGAFHGSMDGNGHKIMNLTINRRNPYAGLFGSISFPAVVTNMKLENVNVVSNDNFVGGLVGYTSGGTISNSYVTGVVKDIGSGDFGNSVGGLVGYTSGGTISNSYATAAVVVSNGEAGGLVGTNGSGAISNSYATGAITGTDSVGGLVGSNGGTISDSYATGIVTGSGDSVGGLAGANEGTISNSYTIRNDTGGCSAAGGLVGSNGGTISNSYATGNVTGIGGDGVVGGLVGFNDGGTINNSHSKGDVTGKGTELGGLVGENGSGAISNSYATGNVTGMGGDGVVGGLVGSNGSGAISYSYATGIVTGSSDYVGGLVGANIIGTISNSYARGDVKETGSGDNVGGLVGYNVYGTISNSYATGIVTGSGGNVGGLVGKNENEGTISNSFYDKDKTGQSDTGKGEGKSTTEMMTSSTYTSWEHFANIWAIDTSLTVNDGYPYLHPEKIVTYKGNGNTGGTVPDAVYQNYNTKVTVAGNTGGLTRTGYTFAGWKTAADGNEATYKAGQTFMLGGDVTLYAHWANSYTVSFNSNGGTTVDSQTVSYNNKVSQPAFPTRSGFIFGGWFSDRELAVPFDFNTLITANVTLYAKWTITWSFTVSFNSNGGTTVDSQTVSFKNMVSQPASPTKSGYTFGGWYSDRELAVPFDFNTPIRADATLYAKWTANSTGNSSGNDNPSTPSGDTVTSTDGTLTLPKGKTGEVSLSDAIKIDIPANATDKELKLTIERVLSTQNLLTNNEVLASPVFEILKNFSENFSKPVTLTFTFDLNIIKDNQKPVVFYYDEVKKEWVNIGGIVNGNKITVEVNRFTKYAVFAVSQADTPTTENPADQATDVAFSDIAGHWAEASIKQAVNNGIVKGFTDGTFKPNQIVSRAEFAVMLINALKPQGAGADLTFTDTAKIGAWAKEAVAQAVKAGMISGYEDGSFRPDAKITRAEMAKMIANALKLSVESDATTDFADDMDIPTWAKGAVAAMKSLGIVAGTGNNRFNPDAPTTRAEAVTVLLKMLAHQSVAQQNPPRPSPDWGIFLSMISL